MKIYYSLLLLIVLSATTICFGQSNIGESAPGYLTSRVPDMPLLGEPGNASVSLTVLVLLSWEGQDHTSFYKLQVSKGQEFTSPVIDEQNLKDTAYTLSGMENNTSYYWRVRASNVAGDGDFSEVWQFTTIVALPGKTILAEPADEASDIPVDLQLKWLSLEFAESYALQVADNPDFVNPYINEQNLTDTLYTLSGLENNTSYYWRVRASNVAGDGEFSEVWQFTTIVALPGKTILAEPADEAVDIPIDLRLKWQSLPGADSYTVQFSKVQDFASIITEEYRSDTSFDLGGLDHNTTFYWRVRASNVAGEGEFSNTWSFTTVDAVGIRDLVSKKGEYLHPPGPNPFSENTIITYSLIDQCKISLFIYNSHGQIVRELVSAQQQPGEYQVKWNGRDDNNSILSSGLYICVLSTSNGVYSQKVFYQQ